MTVLAWKIAMIGFATLSAAMVGCWLGAIAVFFVTRQESFALQTVPFGLIGGAAFGMAMLSFSYYEEKRTESQDMQPEPV